MKISIEKELQKKSIEDKQKLQIDPINEVKLLLQGDSIEEARILRGLSNDSNFARIERVHGQQIELENLENKYQGDVFTSEQIKALAVDYHLRFLPAGYFTGAFDIEVASKIKQFGKDTLSVTDNYSLSRRYFVLAPPEMFKLQDKQYISKKQLDPAIFYQIDNDHYRLIHKWGNDFTVLRYLEGFKWKSYWSYTLFHFMLVLPVVSALLAVIAGVTIISDYPVLFSIGSLILSYLVTYVGFSWDKSDEGTILDEFFTPSNWNSSDKLKR